MYSTCTVHIVSIYSNSAHLKSISNIDVDNLLLRFYPMYDLYTTTGTNPFSLTCPQPT